MPRQGHFPINNKMCRYYGIQPLAPSPMQPKKPLLFPLKIYDYISMVIGEEYIQVCEHEFLE